MAKPTEPQHATSRAQVNMLPFTDLPHRRLQVVFDEPELSSDGGAVIMREAVVANGITKAMAAVIDDPRSQAHIDHELEALLVQRTVQICHGYEDANDCNTMKNDPALKVAVGRSPDGPALASQPTMTRLENSVTHRDLLRMFYVFVDNLLDSYAAPPEVIIIDMDPTANRVYGDQQGALFNGHYDAYCLMPFHVYEGITGRLIATVARPGKTPTKDEIIALLKRIVRRIRRRFPQTMLIFRADSHHTKPDVLDWLEHNEVRYALGMATNPVLQREVRQLMEWAGRVCNDEMSRCRRFHSFTYGAESWSRKRRIVARVEASSMGVDARFIVTNIRTPDPGRLLSLEGASGDLDVRPQKIAT